MSNISIQISSSKLLLSQCLSSFFSVNECPYIIHCFTIFPLNVGHCCFVSLKKTSKPLHWKLQAPVFSHRLHIIPFTTFKHLELIIEYWATHLERPAWRYSIHNWRHSCDDVMTESVESLTIRLEWEWKKNEKNEWKLWNLSNEQEKCVALTLSIYPWSEGNIRQERKKWKW